MLQHKHCVGILGGRPNHAIYFVGYEQGGSGTGSYGSAQLLGLDPHTTFSTSHYLAEPFPSPELSAQIHPAVISNYASKVSGAGGAVNISAANATYESHSCPPAKLAIDQLDPSIAVGFYFRTREEFDSFCREKMSKTPKGVSAGSSTKAKSLASAPSVLYNIEFAPPTYDFSLHEQEEDENGDGGGGLGGGRGVRGFEAGGDGGEDKDDEYVFI